MQSTEECATFSPEPMLFRDRDAEPSLKLEIDSAPSARVQ